MCVALAAVVGSMLVLSIASMQMLSAARGYTQGEALWSKGQKDAILYLVRYAHTRSEEDYRQFRRAIEIPLACRTVRQQMEAPEYDEAVIAAAFDRIGLHQNDRGKMIRLYRHFAWEPHMALAIASWRDGEESIRVLEGLGERIRSRIRAGGLNQGDISHAIELGHQMNQLVTPLEQNFSHSLAGASRWLHNFLVASLSSLPALLIVAGSIAYARLFRRMGESEEKYRHLIETASEAILIADARSGAIIDANHKAVEMFGELAIEEHPSALSLLRLQANLAAEGGGIAGLIGGKHEAHLASAEGSGVDVEFTGSMVNVQGSPLVELIIRDVTEQNRTAALMRESEQRYKLLSEDLRIARDGALEASRAKSQFLANMSHEIRTPMNGVVGMISLVLDRCTDPEQREYLQDALDAAEALLSVINDILDLSRIEAGRMSLSLTDFELRKMCDQALRVFRASTQSKGLVLTLSIHPDCPEWVRGDPTRLRQILVNLVGNAVKFTENGSIDVRVSCRGSGLRFDVEDTGIGIPPGKLEMIFEPFSQADESHSRQFGGTGLGLTITRRLAELMGGRVFATSTPGTGSCFFVELPCQGRPTGQAKEKPAQTQTSALRNLQVLVAEDNRINQRVIQAVLKRQGWTAKIVSNGHDAHCSFLEGRFDIVLMDVQMPEVDGLEATRLIRESERHACTQQRTPIVALTAHAAQQQIDQCLAAGMDAVVTKPVHPSALIEVIYATIAQTQAPLV